MIFYFKIIIGGSHEEIFMEKFMDQVNNEVLKECVIKPMDEEELTKKIHFILNSNSKSFKNIRHQSSALNVKVTNENINDQIIITCIIQHLVRSSLKT